MPQYLTHSTSAPFNLITRKHHCRLCGRVVCFLPPNSTSSASAEPNQTPDLAQAPTRTQRCSTFLMFDPLPPGSGISEKMQSTALSSGYLREVDLGDHSTSNSASTQRERDLLDAQAEGKRTEEMKKGVRVCRECLDTVTKRQKKLLPQRVEAWMKQYQASSSSRLYSLVGLTCVHHRYSLSCKMT